MLRTVKATVIMIGECFRMSLSNIRGAKVRSFLTVLGILIGVMAVITLITTVNGVSGSISDSFSSMGAGTLMVTVTGSDLKTGMSSGDLTELAALDEVEGITPTVNINNARISRGGNYESRIPVSGKNTYYFLKNPEVVIRGRILNFIDEDNMSYVCLIDNEMIEDFFYGVDPVGEHLYINGISFLVVGTFSIDSTESIASIFSGTPNILIPYTTALKMNNTSDVTSFTVYMKDGVTSSEASDAVETAMDAMFSYEEDCFTITTMDAIENTMETMMNMMSSLRQAVADPAAVSDRELPAQPDRRHHGHSAGPAAELGAEQRTRYRFPGQRRRHHSRIRVLCGYRHRFRLGSRKEGQQTEPHRRAAFDVEIKEYMKLGTRRKEK